MTEQPAWSCNDAELVKNLCAEFNRRNLTRDQGDAELRNRGLT